MDHQLILFVIFGVIAFFNWLIRKGGGSKGGAGRTLPPFPRGEMPSRQTQPQAAQNEEERLRKFMEALGVPTVTQPQKKVVQPPQPRIPNVQAPYRKAIPKPVVYQAPQPPPRPVAVPPPVAQWEQPTPATAGDVPMETAALIASQGTGVTAPTATLFFKFESWGF